MGQDKALLDFFSQPWIFEQAWQIRESDIIDTLMVVTQAEKVPVLRNILNPLQDADFKIHFAVNAEAKSKPSDSLACALREYSFDDGAFISPVDVPQDFETLKLLKKLTEKKQIVKPLLDNHGGHPVWLHAKALKKFSAGDRLDQFIHGYEKRDVLEKQIEDHKIVMNLNTLSEWENFKATRPAIRRSAHRPR